MKNNFVRHPSPGAPHHPLPLERDCPTSFANCYGFIVGRMITSLMKLLAS
jgi:hypothetical protein